MKRSIVLCLGAALLVSVATYALVVYSAPESREVIRERSLQADYGRCVTWSYKRRDAREVLVPLERHETLAEIDARLNGPEESDRYNINRELAKIEHHMNTMDQREAKLDADERNDMRECLAHLWASEILVAAVRDFTWMVEYSEYREHAQAL